MTLASSGTMSIGGTSTDRSINLELGRSATATSSLGETDLRTLAGVSSGAISMDDFYGASDVTILWEVGITLGTGSTGGPEPITIRGYNPDFNAGSTTDSSCNLYSNTPTWKFSSVEATNTVFSVNTTTGTPTDNNGWTKLKIYNGTNASGTLLATLQRTSLNYTTSSGIRSWNLGANYTPTSGNRYLVFTT